MNRLHIMNAALAELGEESLDEDPLASAASRDAADDVGEAIALIYPQVRAELLSAHPWTWLLERSPLLAPPLDENNSYTVLNDETPPRAVPAPNPAWPYRYRWRHPSPDANEVRAIYRRENDEVPDTTGWTPVGAYLYTEFSPAYALHQRQQINESAWPQLFVNAVVLKLAGRLALPILFDMEVQRRYLGPDGESGLAGAALRNAQRVNSQSHPTEAIEEFGFVEARLGGYGFTYRIGQ